MMSWSFRYCGQPCGYCLSSLHLILQFVSVLTYHCEYLAVLLRLQRQHTKFFQEASPGLLSVVRLAMQDKEDIVQYRTDLDTSQMIVSQYNLPVEAVRLEIVDCMVRVAQAVSGICNTLHVSLSLQIFRCIDYIHNSANLPHCSGCSAE